MDVLIGIIILLVMYIVIPVAIIGGAMRLLTPRRRTGPADRRTAEARAESRRP